MKNNDQILGIVYRNVEPREILRLSHSFFTKDTFIQLARQTMTHLSETEIDLLYKHMCKICSCEDDENKIDVFEWLKNIAGELLVIRDNQPECHYKELLRWRELTKFLGEDLITCAYLARWSDRYSCEWKRFGWNSIITHDNMQLKQILKRGISDNHFHLYGSAPAFLVGWIDIMNHPFSSIYTNTLRKLEKDRRVFYRYSQVQRARELEDLETMIYKAAMIRVKLFQALCMLDEKKIFEKIYSVSATNSWLLLTKYTVYDKQKLKKELDEMRMRAYLENKSEIVDYALYRNKQIGKNDDFSGERRILYRMLRKTADGGKLHRNLRQWFYAYLVIKAKVYAEMVQVNDVIGFENFHAYSKRGYAFLNMNLPNVKERMIRHAVTDSLGMNSLEIRINPGKNAKECSDMIRNISAAIEKEKEVTGEKNCRIYYVFHFAKKQDGAIVEEKYRHQGYREKLYQLSRELVLFRENAPEEARNVLGIDACSMEIGCRPEVFAPTFRKLTTHIPKLENGVRQWKITYHVGEDFLDLADGLRAIEEAVRFLEMKDGDRLGHAMALGQNVKQWYDFKRNEISINIQDHLDNVVWLYFKLEEYAISDADTDNVKVYLQDEYNRCFRNVYQPYLWRKFVEESGVKNENLFHEMFQMPIYFQAWKLRGCDPEQFHDGIWNITGKGLLEPESYQRKFLNLNNRNYAAEFLYHYYHYSRKIREEGRKSIQIDVPQGYVKAVELVQREMQREIAEAGICVETNPSSNYQISTIQQYQEHPIRELFNLGLTADPNEIAQCPQLHVSINTDDKGVFHTSLKNEFALIACATEQVMDEKGRHKYQKQRVYDWIDRVREFGNQQSFANWED